MDDDKLYIPYGLSIDQEYFPGFGGRELRQLTSLLAALMKQQKLHLKLIPRKLSRR